MSRKTWRIRNTHEPGGAMMWLLMSSQVILCAALLVGVQSRPRAVRQAEPNSDEFTTVTTTYGPLRGRKLHINDVMDLEVFLGVPYASSPTGQLRLAKPEVPEPWTETRDALEHGAKCLQRIIPDDPPMVSVPFEEDCLFLDIYSPSYRNATKVPVMMFIHGGGFYGGSGALYNFTNVALRGVTVVSVSYRLDVFGFLSTEDEIIPGNFGLLDQILALEWIKSNVENFGGNPGKITIFGGSAGAVSASILTLSPLTRGRFQGAILQSGVASCGWGYHHPDSSFAKPRVTATELGRMLNCTLPTEVFSQKLLECLRAVPAELLVNQSVTLQMGKYKGNSLFYPVIENSFGVLPESPSKLLHKMDRKYYIPTIYGYTKEDGSWLVSDPENDGVSLAEFKATIEGFVSVLYPEKYQRSVVDKAMKGYLPANATSLSKFHLRDILIRAATDGFVAAGTVREATLFSAGVERSRTFVYEFNHRPSYSRAPPWMGVGHTDEKGFVLGLPVGPDPFKYPDHSSEDATVADFVVTAWTNFAKFANPSHPLWPAFRPSTSDMEILVIENRSHHIMFNRQLALDVWVVEDFLANDGVGIPHKTWLFFMCPLVLLYVIFTC
ncbi:unnamed protein product [Lymnaea stagnalis]|uniref:Carboxylic ester hydrolase n=1 Tax=Lymnaea stagnalis TaxID=6523 RepID=A0AAV2IA02_LYMST